MTNATLRGKPDAGNPHVRFDEGEVASAKPRRGSLLYKVCNRLFDNLENGRTSVGAVVTMSDLIVSELAGDCGMDFVWIDAEHAPHTIQDVQRHLIALRGTGCAGLVRVRADEPMLIKPYLDLAPDGIIVPMVNTPELAEQAVAACRYPPTGIRGCGVRRAVRYGAVDFFDYVKYSEHWPLVICQIEHIDAVKNLDKILKVPGVDSFCIGPCDLSGSMGILNQMDDPELNRVIDEVATKIKKAGKWLGTAAGDFPRWKARGVDWFAGTSDWGAMAAGIRAFKKDCDKVR